MESSEDGSDSGVSDNDDTGDMMWVEKSKSRTTFVVSSPIHLHHVTIGCFTISTCLFYPLDID